MSLQVTTSSKNRDGDITGVCGSGWNHDKATAIANVRRSASAYYVSVNGRTVHVRIGSRNGRDYLTTAPDNYGANNLDNLPDC
ncbi:DUF3892 domain-containing protein [Microbacterium sp. EST19A]|uniref:DUF3892 domain-containing protein n=1 Tax=Microbacterium sp. EST19A TaxID=2862681 RepID=UPI001CC12AC7|nr:DUF3892 domain-containing protein [Microbacterium sp. EST19A]